MSRPASASAHTFPVIDGIAIVPDTPIFHRRPLHEVEAIAAPRFGDDFWDLTPAMHLRHRKVTVNWLAFPAEFREPIKLYTFALINVTDRSPRLVAANNRFPSLPTIKHDLAHLQRFAEWLIGRGYHRFDQLDDDDLDGYARLVLAREDTSVIVKRSLLCAVMRLHAYREYLPEHCRLSLVRSLWGAATAGQIVGVQKALRSENATPRITPDVMGALLSAALVTIDVIGPDILGTALTLSTMRRIAHESLGEQQSSRWGKPDLAGATARFETLLPTLRTADIPLPGIGGSEPGIDIEGLAVGSLMDTSTLKGMASLISDIAEQRNPTTADLLRVTEFSDVNGHRWRDEPVGARELLKLIDHVVAACLVLTTYLSGIRPGEALNLRRGCISRSKTTELVFLSGTQEKTQSNRRERSPATIPWVVTEHVGRAIALLEQLAPGELLFPYAGRYTPDAFQHSSSRVMSASRANQRVRAFVEWFNTDIAGTVGHEQIAADPHGPITLSRFRRTLAWHIVRRPGGLIAGAIQYGHLRTQITQGYAGQADAGFNDDVGFEEFLLRCETIHADQERLKSGEQVSGPAASSYIGRVTAAREFLGHSVSSPAQARALLANENMQIHHGAFLTCVYRAETAACRDAARGDATPVWQKCKPSCRNIARTDQDIDALEAHNDELISDPLHLHLPLPLRIRLNERTTSNSAIISDHRDTATSASNLHKHQPQAETWTSEL